MAAKASAQITLYHNIDIQAVYRYYLLQSSTAAKPSKPTTFPPSSTWGDVEPSYTEGSTNSLYFVDCTVFSNGIFKYSDVSLSSSYEAAKQAYNKAVNAQNTADDVNEKLDNYATNEDLLRVETDAAFAVDSIKGEIISEVNEAHYSKGDVDTLLGEMSTKLEQTSDSFTYTFEQIQQSITNLDGTVNANYDQLVSYIRMQGGTITLGEVNNPLELVLDKDRLSFRQNGNEIAYVSNNKLYITEAEITHSLKIGKFAFIPRANGSLDFKKVGD